MRLYLRVLLFSERVNSVKDASVTWKLRLPVGRKMSQKIKIARPVIRTRARIILNRKQKRPQRQERWWRCPAWRRTIGGMDGP